MHSWFCNCTHEAKLVANHKSHTTPTVKVFQLNAHCTLCGLAHLAPKSGRSRLGVVGMPGTRCTDALASAAFERLRETAPL